MTNEHGKTPTVISNHRHAYYREAQFYTHQIDKSNLPELERMEIENYVPFECFLALYVSVPRSCLYVFSPLLYFLQNDQII